MALPAIAGQLRSAPGMDPILLNGLLIQEAVGHPQDVSAILHCLSALVIIEVHQCSSWAGLPGSLQSLQALWEVVLSSEIYSSGDSPEFLGCIPGTCATWNRITESHWDFWDVHSLSRPIHVRSFACSPLVESQSTTGSGVATQPLALHLLHTIRGEEGQQAGSSETQDTLFPYEFSPLGGFLSSKLKVSSMVQ